MSGRAVAEASPPAFSAAAPVAAPVSGSEAVSAAAPVAVAAAAPVGTPAGVGGRPPEAAVVVSRQVRERTLLVAAFAAVYVIWGSTYLAIAWAVATIPPLTMIAARCLLAGGVLYAVSRAGAGRPSAAEWRRALFAGVLLFVTGQAMLAWAETRVASGPAALLIATEPMFVALLGWRLRRTGAPTRAVWLALAVGFVGVAVMMAPGRLGGVDALGALVLVAAALSWSLGMFFATPAEDGSPVQAAAMQLIGGGAALVVVAALTGDLGSFEAGEVSGRSLASFFYLVVFGSLITYSAYVWLLRRVGPGRLSSHGYVNPMVAVGLGALLGGESITPAVVLSSLLILSSVVVLVRRG